MANIFWMKRDTDNRARALESTKGLLHCPKIWWTFVYKRLQTGPDISPPSPFCSKPVHQTPSNRHLRAWHPTATLNETALDLSAAQIRSLERCWVGNAVASGGLKWQYVAIIATFSRLSCFSCEYNGWAEQTILLRRVSAKQSIALVLSVSVCQRINCRTTDHKLV